MAGCLLFIPIFTGIWMVIDFIGSPGAGKTTVVPITIESLRQAGIDGHRLVDAARLSIKETVLGRITARILPVRYQDAALWHLFYRLSLLYRMKFALKHFRLHQYVLDLQRNRPPEADTAKRRVIPGFLSLMGAYETLLSRGKASGAILLDEGFIQRVVQLTASECEVPEAKTINTYLDLLPRTDLVIYINTPVSLCLDRVYTRGVWGHLRHKSPEEIARFVTNAHHGVELAVQAILERGWPLVEVRNTDPLEWTEGSLQQQIYEAVTRILVPSAGLHMEPQHHG